MNRRLTMARLGGYRPRALVISIHTQETGVDIDTPVATQVGIAVQV